MKEEIENKKIERIERKNTRSLLLNRKKEGKIKKKKSDCLERNVTKLCPVLERMHA